MVLRFADNRAPGSRASRFRRRRVEYFVRLLGIDRDTRILDIGGTAEFWLHAGVRARITILNLTLPAERTPGFEFVVGDGRCLDAYPPGAFDVVFSNSVLEHVGDTAARRAMAEEVRRVGRGYFVQVPNRCFPLEPHFLFPGFQFLPGSLRREVARRWRYGWYAPGSREAVEDALRLHLPTPGELADLADAELRFGLNLKQRDGALEASFRAVLGRIREERHDGRTGWLRRQVKVGSRP